MLDLLLLVDPYCVLLSGHLVFDETGDIEESSFKIHHQEEEYLVLVDAALVDQDFKLAFLDVLWILTAPYLLDHVNLVALVVVEQLVEELDDCLCLDTAWILVASFQVIEEALLLHLTVEKALERLNFKNGFLDEVVLLEVGDEVTLVVLVLM